MFKDQWNYTSSLVHYVVITTECHWLSVGGSELLLGVSVRLNGVWWIRDLSRVCSILCVLWESVQEEPDFWFNSLNLHDFLFFSAIPQRTHLRSAQTRLLPVVCCRLSRPCGRQNTQTQSTTKSCGAALILPSAWTRSHRPPPSGTVPKGPMGGLSLWPSKAGTTAALLLDKVQLPN